MFERRVTYPERGGWPAIDAYLDERWFSSALLSEERLRDALAPERIEALRGVFLVARRR